MATKNLILAFICTIFAPCALLAQASGTHSAPTDISKPGVSNAVVSNNGSDDARRRSFEIVWRTVKDKHFDPTLGGVDWDLIRRKYEPKLDEIKTDQDLYVLLQQMLGELRQSHFNIISPEALTSDEGRESEDGGIGIDLRMINGDALVTKVNPESTAARAGIRPGYIIKKIGDKSVEQIAAPVAGNGEREAVKDLWITRRLKAEINGRPGSEAALVCIDATNRQVESRIIRERLKGEISPPLGNFPPQYTEFESKRLPGDIGYIRFNIFTTPVIGKVRTAIREMADDKSVRGLIFDLRGNPGGIGGMAAGIAGYLTTKSGSLGTMKLRTTQLNFAFFPQENAYTGPVAILIDGLSGSTSEIFSSGMQEIGRAVVIGERSVGAALPSYLEKLPTGALFQFAIADFKSPKGTLIEGSGVVPDLEVRLDRLSLLAGRDPQLEAAIDQLNKKTTKLKNQ